MNSTQVFDVIERIAATSSKLEKEAIIKEHASDNIFRRVLVAALDPLTTYGMAKRPLINQSNFCVFDDETWLLLDQLASRALTGNAAIEAVVYEMSELEASSSELLWRIISKDLRAGFSESTVNKAIPGLITTFDCMLAHAWKDYKDKVKYPVFVQPKLDGVRVLAFIDPVKALPDSVRFFSRSGREFMTFEHLKEPLVRAAQAFDPLLEIVIDGEIVSGSFNKTVSEVRRKDEQATDAVFHVFDLLSLENFKQDGKGGVGARYRDRAYNVDAFVNGAPHPKLSALSCELVQNEEDVHRLYTEFLSQGLEGAIAKDPDERYHRRRNKGWLKLKAEDSVDVRIIGAYEGEGKYIGTLGGLLVDFNGVEVRVGGGFSDAQRNEFWIAYQRDLGVGVPAYLPAQYEQYSACELLGRVIEVLYHEVTPDGSLRHPRFKRFRDDKPLREAA